MRELFYRYTGAVGQMADPLGDTSEHEHFNLARSTASHNYHINAIFPGKLYDLSGRIAFKYGGLITLDALLLDLLIGLPNDFPGNPLLVIFYLLVNISFDYTG